MCQGSRPSLIVTNEDIEPQNFWASSKSHVAQHIYACNFVVITLVCPTKVSIMKLKCNLSSRMWQHDFLMKQIFFSLIFSSENKGQLAKQAGYLGHDPWHTRYNFFFIRSSKLFPWLQLIGKLSYVLTNAKWNLIKIILSSIRDAYLYDRLVI